MTNEEIDELVETAFLKWLNEKFISPSKVSDAHREIYEDCFRRGCMFGVIMMNEAKK